MNPGRSRPLAGLLCFLLLAETPGMAASQATGPARAEAPAEAAVSEWVLSGVQAYHDLHYETGVDLLRRALQAGSLDPESRQRALLHLGLCLASLGHDPEAREAFRNLLDLDPGFGMDASVYSPKILDVFDEARRERAEVLRTRDRIPPALEVPELRQPLPFRKEIRIRALATDDRGVALAQVFFRRRGENTYTFLPMAEHGAGVYEALIPSYLADQNRVEYYVLVMDGAGNATLKGNAAEPLVLRIAPGEALKPWYKKWWVWTLVGVAAGAGVALGVALSAGDDRRGGTATLRIDLE